MSSPFYFEGSIEASKSLMNRALICGSFFPKLVLQGDSGCDDVVHMRDALSSLKNGTPIWCGEGGTTFRFLALRASRCSGKFLIKADQKLLKRPQTQLVGILNQLGIEASLESDGLSLQGQGWQPNAPVQIDMAVSSQFASALVLSSWDLEFDLEFKLTGSVVSEDYFEMTLKLVQDLGMNVRRISSRHYLIPAGQKILRQSYSIEPDVSSIFAVAAMAALAGRAIIKNFPSKSIQPDFVFMKLLSAMGIKHSLQGSELHIDKTDSLNAVDFDLKNSPDLFPVLAVLCSFAKGKSRLFGAPHLAAKESNRIDLVASLFNISGITFQIRQDGMDIVGSGQTFLAPLNKEFDPAADHRMVMAAALLNTRGAGVRIKNTNCVNKSFPAFLHIAKDYL